MKDKTNEAATVETLVAKKKTLRTIIIVLSLLVLMYGIYFVTKLVAGTWETNNTLGIVGLGGIVVGLSLVTTQVAAVDKELKRRQAKE